MIFGKKETEKRPVSYEIAHPNDVIEWFGKLTLHHQAALMRLMSRNLIVTINDETAMGYDMNFEVVGAIIEAKNNLDQPSDS